MRTRRFAAPIAPEDLAPVQPQHGDVVVHCGHTDGSAEREWFRAEEPIPFERPDGTKGEAQWIVACMDCYASADGNPLALEIRGDGVWQGNEPALRKVPGKGSSR